MTDDPSWGSSGKRQAMCANHNVCLGRQTGPGRPECLGRCCIGRPPQGSGGDSNVPTQAVPHVRPSSLDARRPRPAHLGTIQPNQPTLEVVLSCIFPRDTSRWHSCTVLLDLSGVFILHLACTDRLSRALGHTYTGRPHLFPTHLPDHPFRLQSSYTVLFKTSQYASY